MNRRKFLKLGAGAAGASLGTLGYAILVEPFWLEIVRRNLNITSLPSALAGATLVQISDLHISGRVSESYIIKSLELVRAMAPDIVVYTGDFVTLDQETTVRMERVFPHLPKGRLGTAAILGNHDYGHHWQEEEWARRIIQSAQDVGIPVLRNESLDIGGLQIVGMDDLWARRFDPAKALSRVDRSRAHLVLSHNPDSLDEGDWCGYQGWILSGHTHGGQCKPPFLRAPLLPVRNKRYTAGHIPLSDGRNLYINRGLGYLWQVRFNVRPEITVFTLTA